MLLSLEGTCLYVILPASIVFALGASWVFLVLVKKVLGCPISFNGTFALSSAMYVSGIPYRVWRSGHVVTRSMCDRVFAGG
jgi:hypothetical protein